MKFKGIRIKKVTECNNGCPAWYDGHCCLRKEGAEDFECYDDKIPKKCPLKTQYFVLTLDKKAKLQ